MNIDKLQEFIENEISDCKTKEKRPSFRVILWKFRSSSKVWFFGRPKTDHTIDGLPDSPFPFSPNGLLFREGC